MAAAGHKANAIPQKGEGRSTENTYSFPSDLLLSSPMRRYRRLQRFAAAALAFLLVAGLGGTLLPSHEVFPLASWFLFSLVPGPQSEFDLLLRRAGDDPAGPGRSFRLSDGLVRHSHSVVFHELIQQLGAAEGRRNAPASRALRRQIEADFEPSVARYDLVRVRYAPIERWRTGRVQESAAVRSFTTGEP